MQQPWELTPWASALRVRALPRLKSSAQGVIMVLSQIHAEFSLLPAQAAGQSKLCWKLACWRRETMASIASVTASASQSLPEFSNS